jgi:hypothetical protein
MRLIDDRMSSFQPSVNAAGRAIIQLREVLGALGGALQVGACGSGASGDYQRVSVDAFFAHSDVGSVFAPERSLRVANWRTAALWRRQFQLHAIGVHAGFSCTHSSHCIH